MELGLVGKPNVGKSTLFSALTLAPAEVGNYPFTTVEPNRGVTYVRVPCPHVELGLDHCDPGNSPCRDGTRWVPVEVVDVAGLVPGAHQGKGLGNQFLDDLRQARVLIHVVDASGGTDAEGSPIAVGKHDPLEDVRFLEHEIDQWLATILKKGWPSWGRSVEAGRAKMEEALHEKVSGLGVTFGQCALALRETGLKDRKPTTWTDEDLTALAASVRKNSKPILIAANKYDQAPEELTKGLQEESNAVPLSAASELALRRASEADVVSYVPGDEDFEITGDITDQQRKGLETIRTDVLQKLGGTGVQALIEEAVFKLLDRIVVFPVEDETHFKDGQDRVLPDAFLVPRGCTARDMAYQVHTDLGEGFIRAVDARTKRVVGAEHELKHGDVIRIVSKA